MSIFAWFLRTNAKFEIVKIFILQEFSTYKVPWLVWLGQSECCPVNQQVLIGVQVWAVGSVPNGGWQGAADRCFSLTSVFVPRSPRKINEQVLLGEEEKSRKSNTKIYHVSFTQISQTLTFYHICFTILSTHMPAHMSTCVQMSDSTRAHKYLHTCGHVHTNVSTCVRINPHVHTYEHVHTHKCQLTCEHVHTHIFILSLLKVS